jgi:hypothetical protein
MGLFATPIKTLDDLFVHTLQDIYYAEQQIVKNLPEMAQKASSPELIPTGLSADRYCGPLAPGEGSDPFRHLHELVPGLAAGIDNSFVAWPHLMTEPVLAHEFPHVLSRVQFGCIRRQGQQHDVVGQRQPR